MRCFPADHPVYALFKTNSAGESEAILHSAAGTLVQHRKDHLFHCDIQPGDRMMCITTVSSWLWYWHISGLANGVTIVLYDSNQPCPRCDMEIPRLLFNYRINQFITPVQYLSTFERKRNLQPPVAYGLSVELRAIFYFGGSISCSASRYLRSTLSRNVQVSDYFQ